MVFSWMLYLIACLLLPVLWGAIVNWMFDLWQRRDVDPSEQDTGFPDFQI